MSETTGPKVESGVEERRRDAGAPFVDLLRDPSWSVAGGTGPSAWRRWAPAVLMLALLALAAVAAANVVVNPRAEFPHRWYPPLVGDDPLEKMDGYQELDAAPQRIVLGSSRASLLPPSNATVAGYNFAIPGGGLRDARIAYEYVRREQGPPQHVVLVIDSFQLSAKDLRDVTVTRSQAEPELLGDGRTWAETGRLVLSTLDLHYSQDTARSLQYAHLTDYPEPSRTTAPDGVGVWTGVELQRAAGTFDLAARIEANWQEGLAGRYAPDALPDEEAIRFADQLVQDIAADGAQVQVVLLSFHPDIRPRLDATETFAALQDAALGIAQRACAIPDVEAFDYSDPASIGIETTEFYDGTHLDPSGSAKAAAALEEGRGRLCGGPT